MPTALLFCIVPVGVLLTLYILVKYIRTGSFGEIFHKKTQNIKDMSSLLSQNWIFLGIMNIILACFFHGYIFVFNLQDDFSRLFWIFTIPITMILPLTIAQWLMLRNVFTMRGCLYLSLWITASFMGFYTAGILGAGVLRSIEQAYWSGDTAIQILRGALLGFGLGLGQWLMLCLLRACWPWWVAINVISYMLVGFLLSLWHVALI